MPDQAIVPEGLDEEWDITVQVIATVTVKARPNPDYFEGWQDRDPEDAAVAAVLRGFIDLSSGAQPFPHFHVGRRPKVPDEH